MKHSKAALFLMELIIALLFFALASTVCIRLFTKAYLLSEQTINENHAVIHAQNLAEAFLATDGDFSQIQALFPNASTDNAEYSLLLLFDENWEACIREDAHFEASLTIHPEADGLITADIAVAPYTDINDAIYTLTVTHHIAERRGNLEN